VANFWTEFTAFDRHAMGADVKECKNLRKCLVAATFEKAKTYVFAGSQIMNPFTAQFVKLNSSNGCSHSGFIGVFEDSILSTTPYGCFFLNSGHNTVTTQLDQ
jgi:hypothetical protein